VQSWWLRFLRWWFRGLFLEATLFKYPHKKCVSWINTIIETVWQRNFWDEIILNQKQYDLIKRYIESNPENEL
jgi:hypothetical protein